jgi:hypothetical protein
MHPLTIYKNIENMNTYYIPRVDSTVVCDKVSETNPSAISSTE